MIELESRFGENPDPAIERYERYLSEKLYWKNIKPILLEQNRTIGPTGRKRILYDIRYKMFYNDAKELSSNIYMQVEDKRKLLMKHYSKFKDRGIVPLKNMEDLKVGRLFNHLVKYSLKRIDRTERRSKK